MKARLKGMMLGVLSRLTGRHAVLLPEAARGTSEALAVRAPYRIADHRLTVGLLEQNAGKLDASLFGYQGHFPTRLLWRGTDLPYAGPCDLTLDLRTGRVLLAGDSLDPLAEIPTGRRLSWQLRLRGAGGDLRQRQTGHYLARSGEEVGAAYYQGDNYVDHEAEAAGESRRILRLLSEHGARGPLLEIGCATGAVLAALDGAGIPSVGVDLSSWAIERARERLGPGRAYRADVENEELPAEVRAAGPFSTLLLWAVFEHFAQPFEVLAQLTEVLEPGAVLVVNTVNAASLAHHLFGEDWEGFFDWTHLGAEQVSVASLRRELPRLGWKIERLETHLVWTGSADPSHATLRDWYAADARFRSLLAEREAGDLVTLVARRHRDGEGR
jgi:2-polyprenyl-3-methyl-5-hydroxy-6-metoxy-1,4-benzoquinol methylase